MEKQQVLTGQRAGTGTSLATVRARRTAFLTQLEIHGCITLAAKAVGLSRAVVYQWRKKSPAFAKQLDETMQLASENVIIEARRRGIEGWDEDVYQGGQLVGTIHKYSDTILCRLLSAADPRYRTSRTEVSNAPGEVLKVEIDPTDVARRIAFVFSQAMHEQEENSEEEEAALQAVSAASAVNTNAAA